MTLHFLFRPRVNGQRDRRGDRPAGRLRPHVGHPPCRLQETENVLQRYVIFKLYFFYVILI